MSVDASLPLQKAIVETLRGDPTLGALVHGNVFDSVPPSAAMPYVSLGPTQLTPDRGTGYEGSIERFQVDVWANGPGRVTAKRIGRAVHDALQDADLALDESQRLVLLEIEQTQYIVDPDGLTMHGVLIFNAHTEPAE